MLPCSHIIIMDCSGCKFAPSTEAEEHGSSCFDGGSHLPNPLRDIVPAESDPSPDHTDAELIEACLRRDQRGWALLIERYKRLIYSFPRRYGLHPSDAADVFQLVCAELFVSLPRLRNHESLRSWITTVAAHQAYHWKRHQTKRAVREGADPELAIEIVAAPPAADMEQAEREQLVREAVAQLPGRCRELVRLLFYQDPPVPYETVAQRLGLATGSIGLTRQRCLRRIQDAIASISRSDARRAHDPAVRSIRASRSRATSRGRVPPGPAVPPPAAPSKSQDALFR